MTRKFLEELGLEKETIDKIMESNGQDIQNARNSEAAKFGTERDGLNQKIADLTKQAETRDADLTALNEQLTAAQTDAGKLAEAQKSLSDLQGKYEADRKQWEANAKKQAYESAVRLSAAGLKFSSAAARRAFEADAIAKGLPMEGDKVLGLDDYVKSYRESDPGAFAPDEPAAPVPPPPSITAGTNSGNGTPASPNAIHLNFAKVRKVE